QPLARIGTALPAGYIIAGTPVTVVYNGTVWLIDRQPEYGNNANGKYMRDAAGGMTAVVSTTLNLAAFSQADFTLPVTFGIEAPSCSLSWGLSGIDLVAKAAVIISVGVGGG